MAILPEQNRKKGRETEKRTAIIFFLQRASLYEAATSRPPFSQCIIKFCSFVKRQPRVALLEQRAGKGLQRAGDPQLKIGSRRCKQRAASSAEPPSLFLLPPQFLQHQRSPQKDLQKSNFCTQLFSRIVNYLLFIHVFQRYCERLDLVFSMLDWYRINLHRRIPNQGHIWIKLMIDLFEAAFDVVCAV